MLFNSFQFFVFFPTVVLVYLIIPKRIRFLWLLAASYFFYMCWSIKYGFLLLFITTITWLCGISLEVIERRDWDASTIKKYKKCCIGINFTINLCILLFFKYFDFLIDNINYILNKVHIEGLYSGLDIFLPMGISFYILQALGYTMDVYRKNINAEKNFFKYALFVSFFPQLISGPIGRAGSILSQISKLQELRLFNYDRITRGVHLMLWGFFQKLVIADRIAIVVNQVYESYEDYGFVELFTVMILFSFQIYADFGGYSNIARGAAEVMGIELMDNFRQPYMARDIKSFWRRWHISLTSWFTDYLYIPLGGKRKGRLRQYFNILVVFLCSGLWHGANWTYVIWGILHGVFQIVGNVKKQIQIECNMSRQENCLWRIWSSGVIFGLVSIAWIFFRSDTIKHAWGFIIQMFKYRRLHSFTDMGLDHINWLVLIFALIILISVDCMHESGRRIRESLYERPAGIRLCVYMAGLWMVILFGIYGYRYDAGSFIYSQF